MSSKWHKTEIGQHIDLLTGFPFKSSDYTEASEDIRLLRGDNIIQGSIRWDGVKRWPASKALNLDRYQNQAGDLVIAMDRTWVKSGLKLALLSGQDLPSLLVQRVARLRAKGALDQGYLAQCIASHRFEQYVKGNQTETAVPHISAQQIADFTIPLPPLPQQRKIAAILRAWDEAIGKLSSLCIAKTKLKDGIVQKLLLSSTAFISQATPARVTFGNAFTERQDRNLELGPSEVVTVGKYAIRKQSEHFTRSVASSDLSGYWIISPGDFVYDPMSAYYGALGRYIGDSDGIVSPAYRVLRLRKDVLPEFMVYVMKSHRVRFLLETRSSQGNKEGKRRLLQRDEFAAIDFVLPAQEEQQAFVDTVSQFELDIEHTTALLKAMRQQKQGLMQKLLTEEWSIQA